MKITTIEQVLDLAETLNKVYEAENVTEHDVTIHGVESIEDIKQICLQEKGNFFNPDENITNFHWGYCKLGKINFQITNKKV